MAGRLVPPNVAAAVAAAAVVLLAAPPASAVPRTKITDVCRGCIATVSAASEDQPAPLLVTLHGDWGPMAPELHATWERFAAPRGVAVLSLACPADLGCKRSFWQWNGDPAWINEQVDRLAARRAIDRERVWLAGWSGGASYIGMHTQELERTFAAIVIHGGGIWPLRGGCAAEKTPIIFLVGDKNPLHPHVLKLREHYADCGNEVSFMLLRGAEHGAEWTALDRRGGEILDRLATKRRVAVAASPAPPPVAPPVAPSPPSPDAAALPTDHPPIPRRSPEPVRPRAGCGCQATSRPAPAAWLVGALLATALVRRRLGVRRR